MALFICPYTCMSVCPYVASIKILVGRITQELCGLGCSNFMCTLHMERGRSLIIFKVQFSRSLGLYIELWYLNACGQYIARIMQSMFFCFCFDKDLLTDIEIALFLRKLSFFCKHYKRIYII